jgi:hypothetical protein
MAILVTLISLLIPVVLIALFLRWLIGPSIRQKFNRLLRSDFPGREELVLSELDLYLGPEPNRVKTDILVLSAGSLEDLKRWTRWANNDYREVISAAEYSATSEVGAKVLRNFRERTPENSEGLNFAELMREDDLLQETR